MPNDNNTLPATESPAENTPEVCPVCDQQILETQVGAAWWIACRCGDRLVVGGTTDDDDLEVPTDDECLEDPGNSNRRLAELERVIVGDEGLEGSGPKKP
jgi:hypothetical protein